MPRTSSRDKNKVRVELDDLHRRLANRNVEEEEKENEILQQTQTSKEVRVARQKRQSRENMLRQRRVENFTTYMDNNFYKHTLNAYCHVCDRIWWSNKLCTLKKDSVAWRYVKAIGYDPLELGFKACGTCTADLRRRRTPQLSTVNGFVYPPEANLPALCPISERLISPRLPFMAIRHVRFFEGSKKLYGQVINVPVDVDTMVTILPRELDDDYSINVRIKKNLLNKSTYLAGCVSKSVIKEWLRFLKDTPLYRKHNVRVHPDYLDVREGIPDPITDSPGKRVIHQVRRQCEVVRDRGEADFVSGEQILAQIQETLFWGEDYILEMAPGQHNKPLALTFDADAEELSFPSIYYGQPREFNVPVTPFQMATSEIRRRDRRGVKSNHILYMAGKIMRLRVISSFNVMFRNNTNGTANITRHNLEDAEFLRESMSRNESFLSCLPNSIQYWQRRKSDLFAMMRQLGKPTVFMTLSASEIHWKQLMTFIYRHQQEIPEEQPVDDIIFEEMSATQRAQLVNSDPVLCCLYFDRLMDCIVNGIKLKKGPFGKYRMVDYFHRIEFQHRGSPHCHMLLWLDNAPPLEETKFANGESVPLTIQLIDELCTVDSGRVNSTRPLQTHRHTHTCYKRNVKTCRFGAPFWPMKSTRVLIPVVGDARIEVLVERYTSMREMLQSSIADEDVSFDSIEEFWKMNGVDCEEEYLNIIRHGIQRPTVMYKRNVADIMTSPFNETISSILQSNMDIQYIVDEYSCAAYVSEYVNKADRGFSSLHRELIRLRDEYPDMDYEDCMKEVGKRALNNVEMCVQEAAWFLLRLPMSQASRQVFFIPTQHPSERFKCKKTRKQMNDESLAIDSTDVWKKNIINHYEERPAHMSDLTLAQFVAEYDRVKVTSTEVNVDDGGIRESMFDYNDCNVDEQCRDEDDEREEQQQEGVSVTYRKRRYSKVIKWINFDRTQEFNYKRELVTLFWPFRNEELDVLNDDAYLTIYDTNLQLLKVRRAEYESGLLIDDIVEIVHETEDRNCEDADGNATTVNAKEVYEDFLRGSDNLRVNDQDIDSVQRDTVVRAVKSAMSHEEFCRMVRRLNYQQRSLLLEYLTRLIYGGEPLQLFFTGPAGSGKSYLLLMLMESANRFQLRRNTSKCAFLACATTGKAAVNIDGTTVHSALKIPINAKEGARMPFDKLQTMRCDLNEVCTVIIDEVSMMSQNMLNRVGDRLRSCGSDSQDRFGGFHVVFCGDLRQLPPVRATPVYARPPNMLQDKMLWQNLQYYPLTQVMRQSDKEFSELLTKIGDGRRLTDYERGLLESRFFDAKYLDSLDEMKSAVRLFHTNNQVNDYNYKVLSADSAGMVEVHSEDVIIGCVNNNQRNSTLQKLKKMDNTATGYLPSRLCLVLGTPYMVTQNIDKSDRIVNGSIGILRHIETTLKKGEEYIIRLWLEFEDTACGTKLRIKYQQHMIEHRINSKFTPFVRRELPISMNSRIIKVKRKQFPLLPSNAQTIHKVQGASFDIIVYEYDRSHELALVYVALSRARSLQGLFLTNQKKDHRFRHCLKDNCRVELRTEFTRLESKRLITLVDRCQDFIKDTDISIASLNVQSVHAHALDVSSDHILQNVSALALSETWMHGNGGVACGGNQKDCEFYKDYKSYQVLVDAESSQARNCIEKDHEYSEEDRSALPIDGFRCVTRSRRDVGKLGGGGVAIYESLKSRFTACHHVSMSTVKAPYGDVCCAYTKYKDKFDCEQRLCLLACYCRPGISGGQLMDLMDECMWRFNRCTMALRANRSGDLYWCPLVVCGDFNYNFSTDPQANEVLDYLKNTHMLDFVSKGMGVTTRTGSTIDAVFVKHSPMELMYYTIYFSTHRGILMAKRHNKVKRKKRSRLPSASENISPLAIRRKLDICSAHVARVDRIAPLSR